MCVYVGINKLFKCVFLQDTLVCVSERDPVHCQSIYISTQREGEDVTYTLITHIPEDTKRWTEALWQHVYNMSKALISKTQLASNANYMQSCEATL